MQRNKNNADQLVAPSPTVRFATDEAAQSVISHIRSQYDQAVAYAAQQTTLATQKGEEIDQLRREINDRLSRIEQKSLEQKQCEVYAEQGRNVAKGAADMLAAAGAPVPPPNGELSHDPAALIRNLEAAHDEYDAGHAAGRS